MRLWCMLHHAFAVVTLLLCYRRGFGPADHVSRLVRLIGLACDSLVRIFGDFGLGSSLPFLPVVALDPASHEFLALPSITRGFDHL